MTRRWQRIAGSFTFLILLAITYAAAWANDGLTERELQIAYAFVFHTLLMLLTCVIAATAIAQEKEGDQWTVLLASPLSGGQIIWGKALGVARRLLWPMVAIAAHFFLFTLAGIIAPTTFLLCLVVIGLFNVIWIGTGVTLSLWCRKVTVAVIVNLALPVVLYGVTSVLLVVVDVLLNSTGEVVEKVTWWLPYYYLGEGIDDGGPADRPSLPGGGWEQVSQGTFFAYALMVGLIHLAIATAILWAAAARFNGIVGRAWQLDPLPHGRRGTTTGGAGDGGGAGNGEAPPSWASSPA